MFLKKFVKPSCVFRPVSLVPKIQTAKLHIHEYQSQELMRKNGIDVPNAIVVHTPSEAERAAKDLGN